MKLTAKILKGMIVEELKKVMAEEAEELADDVAEIGVDEKFDKAIDTAIAAGELSARDPIGDNWYKMDVIAKYLGADADAMDIINTVIGKYNFVTDGGMVNVK